MTNIRLLLIGCCLFLLSACGKNGEYRSTSGGFDTYELRCAATTGNVGKEGYRVLLSGIEDTLTEADRIIFLNQACDSTLRKEGF